MRIENENILFFKKAKGTTLQITNYYGHGMINLLLKTIQNVNAHRPLMR